MGMLQILSSMGSGVSLPQQITYTSGSGTVVAPAGATNVIIAAWGGGAGGRPGYYTTEPLDGAGGGSGGYSQTSVAIAAAQTLNYSVGAGGAPNAAGGNSSVTSGTKTITTMSPNGAPNTAGGTASGGTTTNTTGNAAGVEPVAGAGIVGWNSNSAGAGGNGGFGIGAQQVGDAGSAGKVIFYFT